MVNFPSQIVLMWIVLAMCVLLIRQTIMFNYLFLIIEKTFSTIKDRYINEKSDDGQPIIVNFLEVSTTVMSLTKWVRLAYFKITYLLLL